jgi:hypothetical protein
MCTVFVLFLLAWDAASQPYDSVQYCISERASWRVQTRGDGSSAQIEAFAASTADAEAAAETQTRAAFGPAVRRKLTIVGADDATSLQAALQRHGLRGRVTSDDGRRLAYWQAATR